MAPLDSFPERLAVVLFALATTTCSGAKPRVRSPDAACPALATTPLRMFSEAPGFTPLGSFSKGRAVSLQAVRVTQCGIELLPECFPNEMYVVDQSRPTLPRLVIKTDAELKQSLPFDGEEIGKKTQSWLVVETLELGVFHPERPPTLSALGSGCEGATHYVDRVWVGIGELYEWGSPTPFQTTYGKDSGLRAVAFTLRPLGNQPLEACPEGTVFDGENCVPEASELTCPLGTRESGAGCKTAPFVPPKAPARARAAESRYAELQRTTDPATRVAALRELSGYYESDEKGSRAVVYSLLTNDSAIHEACSKRPAAAAASFRRRSPQPSPRDLRTLLGVPPAAAAAPEPAPAPPAEPPQPPWCEVVASLLAEYAELLTDAGQLDSASELNLRLIREHPKSPSSAEAYRAAADKLCRDRRADEANRLYEYIRRNFGATPTARALPAEPCAAAPRSQPAESKK